MSHAEPLALRKMIGPPESPLQLSLPGGPPVQMTLLKSM
jgi:hypothetical protein